MEEEAVWSSTSTTMCCRICVLETDAYCQMNEPLHENGSESLHTVLEKLFPVIFNEEQVQHDFTENWPMTVCQECKRKVQEAYELYEMCIDSCDKLQKPSLKEIVPVDTVMVRMDDAFDGQQQDLKKCCIIPEIEMEVEKPIPTSTRRAAKLRKKEPAKARQTKKTHTIPDAAEIKQEPKQSEKEHMNDDQDDSEYLDEPNTEPEWTPATKSKSGRKLQNPKAKSDEPPKERKKRQRKTKSDAEEVSVTELFRCQLCNGPTYTSPIELTEHLKTEHAQQIQSCDKCPKVFVSDQTFQQHQYCHATGRSFFCNFCDKAFQTEALLTSHEKSHTTAKKFLCSKCGKGFDASSKLMHHMDYHADTKSWPCSLCPSRFNTKASLNVHMRTHRKNEIHTCSTCGSKFNKYSSMVKHQIIHTGARPFTCDICPSKFISTYHLKRHMFTHTGEKPFKCSYCDCSFAQSSILVRHMKTHVGDHPYQCDRCDASFRLLKDLRNHYLVHYDENEKCIGPSPIVDDKDIRFTSSEILKLRYQKEMTQNIQKHEESDDD